MNAILYTKASAVLAVAYVIWLLNSLFTYRFEKVQQKIAEIREMIGDHGEETSTLSILSILIYVLLPIAYLSLLYKAELHPILLVTMAAKLALTSTLSIYTEKQIFSGGGYTRKIHSLSQADTFVNIAVGSTLLYFLIFPPQTPS